MVVFSMNRNEEEKKNVNDDPRFIELNKKISVIEDRLNELTAQNKYYESVIKELQDTISGFINEEDEYCDGDCENCLCIEEKLEEAEKILNLFEWSEINDINPVGLTVFEVIEKDNSVTCCYLYNPYIVSDYDYDEDDMNKLIDYIVSIYLDEEHCHHNMVSNNVNVIKISKEMFDRLSNAFEVYEEYYDMFDEEEDDEE